jgi:4-amino-4-deoxy-L-arabinose transferase-like glycosyltransferase
LDGNLPYTELFDNKPPVFFFALAGVMKAFGEHLFVVRLFGDVCFLLICIFTFHVAARITGTLAAALGTVVLIAASALPFGQHTQTEHFAIMLVMSALWLLTSSRQHLWPALLTGVLMSLAMLTRTNLFTLVIGLAAYYAVAMVRTREGVHKFAFLAYVLGALVPLAVLAGLYAGAGALETLWLCAVEVPAAYAFDQKTILYNLGAHAWKWLRFVLIVPWIFVPATLLVASGVFIFLRRLFASRTGRSTRENDDLLLIGLSFGCTFCSVLVTGVAHPHYWNQLLPFAAIFVAVAISAVRTHGPIFAGHVALVLTAALSALAITAPSSVHVLTNWSEVRSSYPIRRAANAIATDRTDGDEVWALENHLVLWYLDQDPVSPAATHPHNLVGEPIIGTLTRGGYVPPREFERVLSIEPKYLVLGHSEVPWYLEGADADTFRRFLSEKYSLWNRFTSAVPWHLDMQHQRHSVSVYRRKT